MHAPIKDTTESCSQGCVIEKLSHVYIDKL